MIKKLLAVSILLAFSATVSIVHAKDDVKAGKQQATACAGCHGAEGNSAVATFPKLAGQHATYLIKQLRALKNGTRNAPMMASFAMGLSDDAISDLAAFYASQTISKNPMPQLPTDNDDDDEEDNAVIVAKEKAQQEKMADLLAKGGQLYRNGDLKNELPACIACHGLNGEGNQPAGFPALRRQHADYLIKTLTDFKNGSRIKTPENIMNMIAKKMSAEEIQAISYYLSVMNKKAKSAKK